MDISYTKTIIDKPKEHNKMQEQTETIQCVIVDDEQEGIHTLEYMLKHHCPQIEVIQTYQNSVDALKGIRALQPDLLFLDIKMPEISGLELLDILGPNQYRAVFVTAHDEYMLKALRLHAFDYLLKPVNEIELTEAIKRIEQSDKIDTIQLKEALHHLEQGFEINKETRVGIKEGNRIKFVALSEICHCQSDGNFTNVHLTNGETIFSSHPLKDLEDKLPEKYFFRCHREYLINGHSIDEFDRADGGFVKMICYNESIPVSRGKRSDFLQFIQRFL